MPFMEASLRSILRRGCRQAANAKCECINQELGKLKQAQREHEAQAAEAAKVNADLLGSFWKLSGALEATQVQLQELQQEHTQQLDALTARCDFYIFLLRPRPTPPVCL
jgi:DNA-binding transcriptional regulator PaaX